MKNRMPLVVALVAAISTAAWINAQDTAAGSVTVAGGVTLSGNASPKSSGGSGDTAFADAIKQLEESVTRSMEAFSKAGQPNDERLKGFDEQCAAIDNALKATTDGGALDQAINKAMDAQSARISRYETIANDPKAQITDDIRSSYEEFIKKAKERKTTIMNSRAILRRLRSDLSDARKSLDVNKQFYVDALAEDDLDMAGKALEDVNKSMVAVTKSIQALKAVETKSSGKVQQ